MIISTILRFMTVELYLATGQQFKALVAVVEVARSQEEGRSDSAYRLQLE